MKNLKNSGIYGILNIINNKIYIGSSKNISSRLSRHFYDLNRNNHHNQYLQNAYNKYGKESFQKIILEKDINIDKLLERELHWVTLKNSTSRSFGYNLATPDPNYIQKHAEESKDKTRRYRYKQLYGNIAEEEYQKLKNKSLENKKIKEIKSVNFKKRIRIVELNVTTNEYVNTYDSIKNIQTFHDYSKSNMNKIQEVLSSKYNRKSYKGFVYVYEKDYNKDKDYSVKENQQYKQRRKLIYQLDENYNLIKEWNHIDEVLKHNSTFTKLSIYTALSRGDKYKSFYWSRKYPL